MTLSLPEHNVLFGAEPGGGKSVALSVLVAAFALDPTVTLWLFDGKLVELAPWLDCAKRFVGPDIELAISVLEELRCEMDERYRDLLARKARKVTPGDGLGLHVVVIDELALYVAGVDKKLASRFSELLRDLVARGRAAGIIVLAATQKPSIDIVPSALRDLFGFRWALALCHQGSQRHRARERVGLLGLLGGRHRPGPSWRRTLAARRWSADSIAELSSHRRRCWCHLGPGGANCAGAPCMAGKSGR